MHHTLSSCVMALYMLSVIFPPLEIVRLSEVPSRTGAALMLCLPPERGKYSSIHVSRITCLPVCICLPSAQPWSRYLRGRMICADQGNRSFTHWLFPRRGVKGECERQVVKIPTDALPSKSSEYQDVEALL